MDDTPDPKLLLALPGSVLRTIVLALEAGHCTRALNSLLLTCKISRHEVLQHISSATCIIRHSGVHRELHQVASRPQPLELTLVFDYLPCCGHLGTVGLRNSDFYSAEPRSILTSAAELPGGWRAVRRLRVQSDHRLHNMAQYIARACPTLQHLWLDNMQIALDTFLPSLTDSPLQDLVLGRFVTVMEPGADTPPGLTRGDGAPRLRSLTLCSWAPPALVSKVGGGLRELKVLGDTHTQGSLGEWCEVLGVCGQLELLELDLIANSQVLSVLASLPNLTHLWLRGIITFSDLQCEGACWHELSVQVLQLSAVPGLPLHTVRHLNVESIVIDVLSDPDDTFLSASRGCKQLAELAAESRLWWMSAGEVPHVQLWEAEPGVYPECLHAGIRALAPLSPYITSVAIECKGSMLQTGTLGMLWAVSDAWWEAGLEHLTLIGKQLQAPGHALFWSALPTLLPRLRCLQLGQVDALDTGALMVLLANSPRPMGIELTTRRPSVHEEARQARQVLANLGIPLLVDLSVSLECASTLGHEHEVAMVFGAEAGAEAQGGGA